MEERRIAEIREHLLQMRSEMIREIQQAREASRQIGGDGVADIGDMSVATYARDVLLNLSDHQRQRIRDIDAAIDRLDAGEYGVCQRCEEEIEPRRLEVRPFSRYCVECKTEIEKFGE